jgi:dTDP-4-dehydrorhamnose 3,5-epimerase
MALKFLNTEIPGVRIVQPDRFDDERGFFMENYHRLKYGADGIDCDFVQDNHSRSKKGVLRGLHYQLDHPQDKLVSVISGEIFDVVVDIRRGSPTFSRWVGIRLSEANRRQLFIPKGFAHGFCVLSNWADVIYKISDFYCPEDDRGIIWSDPSLAVDWPVKNPFLSEKDVGNPRLTEIPEANLPLYGK